MCLLVVGLGPDSSVVVGANRDELYDRPAVAMSVLQSSGPRILGGRDMLAGGTWLAVNEHGVFAGLTNRPSPGGRDPSLRSRGELPLALAMHSSAQAAVAEAATWNPSEYNAAWMLVGDKTSLFYVEVAGSSPMVRELGAGIHVLENRPLDDDAGSPKVTRVRTLLAGGELSEVLPSVLRDHMVPESSSSGRPAATEACCVHAERYGTRSSVLVTIAGSAAELPDVRYCEGRPCENPFVSAADLWLPS